MTLATACSSLESAARGFVSAPLAGRAVVVTRPAGQATALAAAIEAQGGQALLFPVLAIADVLDPAPLLALAQRLDDFDLAIFISANAVHKALTPILARRTWPAGLRVATVGKASERQLAAFGLDDIIAPSERFDSEALLALAPLTAVAGKKIVVFRGDGGRELLGDTLQQRGATVEYVTCYRRSQPKLDPAPLFDLWRDGRLSAITLTSSEGLRNLWQMLGADQDGSGRALLTATPIFVPHPRIAEQAQQLGLARLIATGPGDTGLVSALIEYFGRQ